VSIIITVDLTQITCGECGGVYAIGERYREKRQQDGTGWHCPYCDCSWDYFSNGENARLKRELAQKEEEIRMKERAVTAAKCEAEAARLQAHKAALKCRRIEKRVRAGVCPCCNRTFSNLARHMQTKHPDDVPSHTIAK
jgi:hypothetical protein